MNALVGPARHLDTVAGFTAWRSLGVLGVIGAIWGLLAATRLLRGEEDAGRWELLLSGHASRRGATTQTLVGIAVGLVALWATASAVIAVAGRSSTARISPTAAGFLAAALVAPAAVFVAIGAVTSQLAATRRQAAGWAGGLLAVAYVLRMVAGSSARLSWLRWLSPLGWVEQLHPLTGSAGSAFLPIVALVAVLVATSIGLAGRLDLGGSVIRDRVSSEPRTRLLASPFGLAVRLGRSVVLAWTLGIAAMALLMGTLARTAGRSMEGSAGLAELLARMGARGSGAAAYLGLAFLVVGVMIVFAAAGQVAHAREEEAEGRLDQLLARPVGRTRWLSGRILLIVVVVFVDGCVAGLVAWLGTASQHDGLGLSMLLEAGLNVVAPRAARGGHRGAGARRCATRHQRDHVRLPRLVVPAPVHRRLRAGQPLAPRHVDLPPHDRCPCRCTRLGHGHGDRRRRGGGRRDGSGALPPTRRGVIVTGTPDEATTDGLDWQQSFIEDLGVLGREGLPRSATRILGWLVVCTPAHQTGPELQQGLHLSPDR